MKRLYYIFIALCVFLVNSCGSDDHQGTNMDPVTDVSADPFIGSVILKFKAPTVEQYYYTLITYKDSEGNTKHQKVSSFNRDASGFSTITIGGFTDTEIHNFELQTCSYDGGISETVTASAAPQAMAAAKDYVLGTLKMEPAENAAQVSWTNLSGVAVNLTIKYKDYKGRDKSLVIDAQKSGSREIEIWKPTDFTITAQNVADQSVSSPKVLSVVPQVDPNDLVQDGVEYLTLSGGGINQLNITRGTEDNPYEYTLVTTGGDPFVPIDGLKAAKAGTKFVFRYKASADFTLELFWCDRGGGAAGGRSTTVDVKAASKWTTFSYDYDAAMKQHHWTGKQGDFFRTDWGSSSGVTIHVRNMHFE